MSGYSVGDTAPQTQGIWLSVEEANFITGILVELPFKVSAPIIQILGAKLMEAKNGD